MKEEFSPLKITQASFTAYKPVRFTLHGIVCDLYSVLEVQQKSSRCQGEIQHSLQMLTKVLPKMERQMQ